MWGKGIRLPADRRKVLKFGHCFGRSVPFWKVALKAGGDDVDRGRGSKGRQKFINHSRIISLHWGGKEKPPVSGATTVLGP